MDLKTYLIESGKTIGEHNSLEYLVLGLVNEAGELLTPIKRFLYHKQGLDKKNIKEELCDMWWHVAGLIRYVEVIDAEKLESRLNSLATSKTLVSIFPLASAKATTYRVIMMALDFEENPHFDKPVALVEEMVKLSVQLGYPDIRELFDSNIEKLRARHGEKYSQEFYDNRVN